MFSHKILPLLNSHYHSLILSQERTVLILSRIRLVALILMLLMVLWIPIDFLLMPWDKAKDIVIARVVCAVLLGSKFFYRPRIPTVNQALVSFVALLAVPMFFYWYANTVLLDLVSATPETAFVKMSYMNFSILLTMLLTLFPLTAIEGILFGTGLVAMTALVLIVTGGLHSYGSIWGGTIWQDISITSIAIIASISQLHFMAGFVELSAHDRMTGLLKRDYGTSLLETLFQVTRRNDIPLCAVFVDLDDFKKVNDVYGHEAGDNVLIEAAHNLMESVRSQDVYIRWGGEEFLLILPGARVRDIEAVLNRICSRGLGLRPDGKAQTASIGVADRLEDDVSSVEELVQLADQRMYAAKKAGKNTVVLKTGSFHITPGHNLLASSS